MEASPISSKQNFIAITLLKEYPFIIDQFKLLCYETSFTNNRNYNGSCISNFLATQESIIKS